MKFKNKVLATNILQSFGKKRTFGNNCKNQTWMVNWVRFCLSIPFFVKHSWLSCWQNLIHQLFFYLKFMLMIDKVFQLYCSWRWKTKLVRLEKPVIAKPWKTVHYLITLLQIWSKNKLFKVKVHLHCFALMMLQTIKMCKKSKFLRACASSIQNCLIDLWL